MKSLFHGCLSVEEQNGAWYPVRFTNEQLAFYSGCSAMCGDRARCSAGCSIRFVMETDCVTLRFRTDCFVRSHCTFDVYENGDLIMSHRFAGAPSEPAFSIFRKAKGRSEIEVVLPFTCRAGLLPIQESVSAVADARPLYLAFGDSITQGMESEYPSLIYPSLLARDRNLRCINQGVGTFRFHPDSLKGAPVCAPQLITVAYGTNDLNQIASFDEITANAQTYLDTLKELYPGSEIIVISPIWRQTALPLPWKRQRFHAFQDALRDICETVGMRYVCGLHLVPNLSAFFHDGLHPNALGFSQYTLSLLRTLDAQAE